ncbi:peptidoglycan editing factor PgeF [Paenibacillus abyssi]|nr:peptidoglycan editing factor PgeF [Paenibacillus abyssi]
MDEQDGLTAGFTGRHGGVSGHPWTSLNLGLHVGDEPARVVQNRRLVAESLKWPFDAWTCAEQVHGCRVRQVTSADRGSGRENRAGAIADCDALMTNETGVLLTSFYADCVPIYYVDPVCRVIALAHAGWKGTVLEIARMTVESMKDAYGSEPKDIFAAIGPSIGQCCYEVDQPVIERVEPLVQRLSTELEVSPAEMMLENGEGKARLNLKEINRQIMIKAGILPTHIELTERCTGCRTDLFFSHRMEDGKTGRMVSWIGMKER